jgi:ATP-dependent Clp protease ATP-binding subunit ClpC
MFERYSERARRAIFFARDEALRRNAGAIETSDLVFGLTRETPEPGSPISPLHERTAELRVLFGAKAFTAEKTAPADIPLTPQSKLALGYAAQEADRDGTYPIDADHLLRGVLRTDDSTAKKLAQAGWTLKGLRAASRTARQSQSKARLPFRRRLKIYRLRIILGLGFAAFIAAFLYMVLQR